MDFSLSANAQKASLPKLAVHLNLVFAIVVTLCASTSHGQDRPKPAPIPTYRPATKMVAPGEFTVGVITITFRETALPGTLADQFNKLNTVKGREDESGRDKERQSASHSGITQEEYFKIYSNNLSWPKLEMMPNTESHYQDEYFYGYYCEYDYWLNPIGWKTREEGADRVEKMNKNAVRFAQKDFRGKTPKFVCYNYITTRPETPDEEVTNILYAYYKNRSETNDRKLMRKARRNSSEEIELNFEPWDYYRPEVKWAEPMWPNSKIQVADGSGGVLAHEIGHKLGAPDVYHVGRYNDGISGDASLLAYGPTANAFSRFYHHAFIGQENHPVLKSSGTYTLHPRHIDPKGNESLGFLIPSNHPHYAYHVEYIYGENKIVGVGPQTEGMLISAVNLGRSNFLGSPDYFYVYRPDDPFFRGVGDTNQCLFGKKHGRTSFNMETKPSSRLPNLLDGGISISNIQEQQGTLTFDLEINKQSLSRSDYELSMLPQIRLDEVTDIQPTSCTMDCTIKFRGEPIKTVYGFCWSTSPNPTVRDETYALMHREWYRGHAINLRPDTTYYIRAFASNGLGYRYSDEEKVIKTPPLKDAPKVIGPLLTDAFSNNAYLYRYYSQENLSTMAEYANFSPTCVLAKLVAYYRPDRFMSAEVDGNRARPVDFNKLSWNPSEDDFPMRLDEIDGFFQAAKDSSKELELREVRPNKNFIRNLKKFTGFRSKAEIHDVTADNLADINKLIHEDLKLSRPVIIIFHPEREGGDDLICWGIIDGINTDEKFHLDLPMRRQVVRDHEIVKFPAGYYSADDLLIPDYKVMVVTSCYDTP